MSQFRQIAAVLIARGARPERGRTLLRIEDALPAGARAASQRAGCSFLKRAGLAVVAGASLAAAGFSMLGLSLTTAEQRGFITMVLNDPPIAPGHYAACQAMGQETLRPIIDAVGQAPRRDEKAFGAGWFAVGVHPLVDMELVNAFVGIGRYLAQVPRETRNALLNQFFTATAAIHDPRMKAFLDRIGALSATLRDAVLTASEQDLADAFERLESLKRKDKDIAMLKDAIGRAEHQKKAEHQRLTAELAKRHGHQWLTPACFREVEQLPFRAPGAPAPLAPKRIGAPR